MVDREKRKMEGEIKRLKRRLQRKDKELKETKLESQSLLAELESAYKELRDTQEEMLRREKLASTGSLAAGVAHEIRNPLSVIGMSVQYLHSKFGEDDPRREYTKAVIDKVERLDRVTKELIDFSRPRELNLQTRDLHRSLNNVLTLSEAKCKHQRVKIIKRYAKNIPPVVMDEELVEQVFLNLVSNALEAMPRGGKLLVSTSHLPEEGKIAIEFRDTGRGISSKEKKYIFDPFYSTKTNGTGLGLSISQRIIDDHRGSTEVKSRKGRGTTFTIVLPVKG